MHQTFYVPAALLAMAGISFAGAIPSTNIYGNYVEARTADVYTGPCFANSEVGLVGQLAVFGWKVTKGAWQGVDLDGMSVVGVVRAHHTLGDVFESAYPVKAVIIVDTRANPSSASRCRASPNTWPATCCRMWCAWIISPSN
jgi:hypothetical protein